MSSLLQLWKFIKPYSSRIFLNVLFNTLSSVFAIFSLLMLIPFLKLLFDKAQRVDAAQEFSITLSDVSSLKQLIEVWLNQKLSFLIENHGELRALAIVCIAVVIVFFLKNMFRYLALFVVATVKRGVVKSLHSAFYEKMLAFPMSYFNKQKKGDLMSRFTSDVLEVEYGILYFLESFLKDPITILLTLFTMFAINVRLTLIVLITLPISGLVIGGIGKKLKHESKIVQELFSKLVARLEETISGARVIKSFTAQNYLSEQFNKENNEHYKLSKKMLRKRDLSSPMSEFLGIVVVVIILWLGGQMVFDGRIEPETFIAYIVIFSQIISPSKAFSNAFYYVQKGRASLERIDEIIQMPTEENTSASKTPIQDFNHKISFEAVNFQYDDQPVLSDINFEIKKGDKVALKGISGAGKSTFVDLLLHLYPIKDGQILIDDQPLSSIEPTSWRKLVALVPQETLLFNDSLEENIRFGLHDLSHEALEKAIKFAQLEAVVNELPEGIQTNIGDNGNRLSGGQRQRVAIARAFLKNAPILILDEATSALDAKNENIITETLMSLPAETTVIIIAHRSSTISACNVVVELEKGNIKQISRSEKTT